MNIVLTGAPGAGKDTLAKKLETQYNFRVLTTGDLYRKEAELGTEFGLKAKEYWIVGNLCPDEMTNNLMRETVSKLNGREHIVFNGYPRTVAQAEYLDNIIRIDLNIHLEVSEETALERLLKRGRIDDKRETIKKRFEEFNLKALPLIEYYGDRWCRIVSNDTEEAVLQNSIKAILNKIG